MTIITILILMAILTIIGGLFLEDIGIVSIGLILLLIITSVTVDIRNKKSQLKDPKQYQIQLIDDSIEIYNYNTLMGKVSCEELGKIIKNKE